MRRGNLAAERFVGHTVDQINIKPPVIVVVEQGDPTPQRVDNQGLRRRSPDVLPCGEAGRTRYILEDYRALLHDPSCGDRAIFRIMDGCIYTGCAGAALLSDHRRSLRLLRMQECFARKQEKHSDEKEAGESPCGEQGFGKSVASNAMCS